MKRMQSRSSYFPPLSNVLDARALAHGFMYYIIFRTGFSMNCWDFGRAFQLNI